MKRTPLPSRRATPRRKAPERIVQTRIKPKAGARPTPSETVHMARVALLPCLVCGASPVTLHHVTGYAMTPGRFSRSHKRVAPLCPRHHLIQHGPRESVEALGHQGFYRMHGVDLLREAMRLWQETAVTSSRRNADV